MRKQFKQVYFIQSAKISCLSFENCSAILLASSVFYAIEYFSVAFITSFFGRLRIENPSAKKKSMKNISKLLDRGVSCDSLSLSGPMITSRNTSVD